MWFPALEVRLFDGATGFKRFRFIIHVKFSVQSIHAEQVRVNHVASKSTTERKYWLCKFPSFFVSMKVSHIHDRVFVPYSSQDVVAQPVLCTKNIKHDYQRKLGAALRDSESLTKEVVGSAAISKEAPVVGGAQGGDQVWPVMGRLLWNHKLMPV